MTIKDIKKAIKALTYAPNTQKVVVFHRVVKNNEIEVKDDIMKACTALNYIKECLNEYSFARLIIPENK